MATFEYKVKNGDTLQLGDSSNTVSVPGAQTVAGNLTVTGNVSSSGVSVKSYEKVTTTGSSDVVDPAVEVSLVTTGGAHTVTLADGSTDGQVKTIILAGDGGNMTLTPANFADGTSLTFADVLDSATLIWDGSNWNVAQGAGLAIV